MVRSVMMSGPKAAATPALCKNLLRVRWKCRVVFISASCCPASRHVTRVCDDDRIRLLGADIGIRGRGRGEGMQSVTPP